MWRSCLADERANLWINCVKHWKVEEELGCDQRAYGESLKLKIRPYYQLESLVQWPLTASDLYWLFYYILGNDHSYMFINNACVTTRIILRERGYIYFPFTARLTLGFGKKWDSVGTDKVCWSITPSSSTLTSWSDDWLGASSPSPTAASSSFSAFRRLLDAVLSRPAGTKNYFFQVLWKI